jgi:hypothetical protein
VADQKIMPKPGGGLTQGYLDLMQAINRLSDMLSLVFSMRRRAYLSRLNY